jgi:hypothetical protein
MTPERKATEIRQKKAAICGLRHAVLRHQQSAGVPIPKFAGIRSDL